MKKYRIKRTMKWIRCSRGLLYCPTYTVLVRSWFGLWVNVKSFCDTDDPDFARREAEELLDKLEE